MSDLESESLSATLHLWVEVFMRRSMQNFMLFARESGLTLPQVSAMFHVRRKGFSGVSDIGDDLGVTSAAASQMLERLVQQGYVLRDEDPADRRLKQIRLTEKGAAVLREVAQARQKWLDDLVDSMSPAEQVQVASALDLLIEKARLLEQQPVEK